MIGYMFYLDVQSQTQGSCNVFGTQHILTFDNQRIDFNSDLEFTLAKTCPPTVQVDVAFDISLQYEYKYPNIDSVSQAKCLRVIYKGVTAKLCADQTAWVRIVL